MHTKEATIIGGPGGLWVPGATVLGLHPLAGGEAVIIDMTTPTLDSRITYNGPAHYYWSEDGMLALGSSNEWQLEYRDGVAVGRHEPEPAATNYQVLSRGDTASQVPTTNAWRYLGITFSQAAGPDGNGIGAVNSGNENYGIYNDTAGEWIIPETTPPQVAGWQILTSAFSLAFAAQVRTYTARNGTGSYLYGVSSELPAGDYTMSMFRKYSGVVSGFATGWVQIESGSVATSPIITTDSPGTRSASAVTVDTSSVSSILVRYSNGESDTYQTPAASFTLPVLSRNWSERYITEIEMRP